MLPFDVKKYKESLKTKYNIADEDLAEWDQNVTSKSEFSRYQAEHKTKMAALEQTEAAYQQRWQELNEYETYVKGLEQTYGPRDQWSTAFARAVGQYNPDGSGNLAASQVVDARIQALEKQLQDATKTFSEQLEQVGRGAAVFAEFYYEANEHFRNEYGKPLPKDDFKKFFQDNGHTDPRIALQLFEAPFKAEKEKAAWEQKVKDAEIAAEQRVRSQLGSELGAGSGMWNADTRMSIGAAAPNLPAPNTQADDAKAAETAAAIRKAWAAQNPSAPAS